MKMLDLYLATYVTGASFSSEWQCLGRALKRNQFWYSHNIPQTADSSLHA